MQTIPLTQGKVAQVDDSDFAWLSVFKWYAARYKHLWYAQRETVLSDGRRTTVKMHREILGLGPRDGVDHEDGDGLNNQRGNLRHCTSLQNGANKRKPNRQSTSRFKGVHKRGDSGKWRASIRVNWKLLNLGTFFTEVEAARAYDAAALDHHGEFACFNFPTKN